MVRVKFPFRIKVKISAKNPAQTQEINPLYQQIAIPESLVLGNIEDLRNVHFRSGYFLNVSGHGHRLGFFAGVSAKSKTSQLPVIAGILSGGTRPDKWVVEFYSITLLLLPSKFKYKQKAHKKI